jgi:predicted peptidase
LLKPAAVRAGEQYPLLLFLHGAGERGTDNRGQIKHLAEWMALEEYRRAYPCFFIAPQCRPDRLWVETPRAFDPLAPRHFRWTPADCT